MPKKSKKPTAAQAPAIPPPPGLVELVERFREHADDYAEGRYNETELRRDFLDPLLKTLGWDVHNEQGYHEAYREVIHEDAIKIGGATKAPDYCCRVGGTRKFFVEAKKPSVDIRHDIGPAFQLRRYAWSAKLPLSILTDFEEMAVYDCRVKPAKTDKASAARVMYFRYDQYPQRWGELASVFSREAILKGSFDKYAASMTRKRGTAEVDDAFLGEIEKWRDMLARNFALRNADLSQRDLNFAVQRTIDRIVFLRICEDRGIEPYGTLQSLLGGPKIYERLFQRFRRADERYNSGLFHFEPERDRAGGPDELTPSLALDDKPLKEILTGLYYPESPYEFAVLPADILGQVYEQFLGKVIRLTRGHQAKVEEKPEVRKAGGVYYTPTYIVDYIVEQTVGKLVEGKTPQKVGGLTDRWRPSKKLRPVTVLDPACGSGSFLLGAYQFLLDWYRDRYEEDGPEKHARGNSPRLYRHASGEWRLTTAERKRILTTHIFGVDIDSQAVETTKLSLLLKVLEGESGESLENQRRMFHERALPDLSENIKCGNSLIGPDFYDNQQMGLFDEEERLRINVFDWQAEFAEIFAGDEPGFDAVIGNPPYIRIQTMRETAPETVDYYNHRYAAAGGGNYDIYVLFVERGLSRLNASGFLGYILPNKFFATDYGESLRGILTQQGVIRQIVDFQHGQVFHGATTYTCLLLLSRASCETVEYASPKKPPDIASPLLEKREISASQLSCDAWSFATKEEMSIDEKLDTGTQKLLELPSFISRGSSSGADNVFVLRCHDEKLFTRDGAEVEIEMECLRIPLYASDFGRYRFRPCSGERIIFPYRREQEKYSAINEEDFKRAYPKCYSYLRSRKDELVRRKQYRQWFGFSAPRNLERHGSAHLMVPLLANEGLFCRLPQEMPQFCPMASGGFSITLGSAIRIVPEYVLGLMNSRLLFWKLARISNHFRGGWITCTKQYVGQLPIRTIDFDNPDEKAQHDRMVSLVQTMLDLHRELEGAKTPHGRTAIQRQIEATDQQIDRLVYELYELTDDEIRLVEEATASVSRLPCDSSRLSDAN